MQTNTIPNYSGNSNNIMEMMMINSASSNSSSGGVGSMRLLEFKAKLTYDATYAKTEKEKGYAVEMQKQIELLENKK